MAVKRDIPRAVLMVAMMDDTMDYWMVDKTVYTMDVLKVAL